MSMALAWNIMAGHIVSMVGTQHFSLSQASPIINEMVWDKVQEQMTEMRAQIKEEIKVAVEFRFPFPLSVFGSGSFSPLHVF